MKTFLMVAALFFTSLVTDAQTRRIAHRFHSGAESEHYDGHDGNYGGGTGMHSTVVSPHLAITSSSVILIADTVKTKDGRDSTFYKWDTLPAQTPAHVNAAHCTPVHRMRDLGKICTTLTER